MASENTRQKRVFVMTPIGDDPTYEDFETRCENMSIAVEFMKWCNDLLGDGTFDNN